MNIQKARAFAERIAELGCGFALDDFGAGFGSFYYLKHLPFDVLKIDGEFVRNLTVSVKDQAVVKSLARIASELGKQTVAEFVEDAETLELAARATAWTSRRASTSASPSRSPRGSGTRCRWRDRVRVPRGHAGAREHEPRRPARR